MKKQLGIACLLLVASCFLQAQNKLNFSTISNIKTTSVKNQGRSGTCWAFSTTSFIESEIIRMGGPSLDLSEMYTVDYCYQNKARQYVFRHGTCNFGEGGQAHDVLNVIRKHGFVPENDFLGRKDTTVMHNHAELVSTLKTLLNSYVKSKNAQPKQQWFDNFKAILTSELGKLPKQITFNNRNYTPMAFADALGFKPDNYIELTSYTHHPYDKPFVLEVPDNWADGSYYNLKLDELINTMKDALKNGYSMVWDGDVSNRFFSYKDGLAILPLDESNGIKPQKEKEVTAESRQKNFLNWNVTDDHLMHIVGLVKDANGTIYFKTKNSWSSTSNNFGGYLYMSEAYVRMNTIAIMLHKDAISKELHRKLFNRRHL